MNIERFVCWLGLLALIGIVAWLLFANASLERNNASLREERTKAEARAVQGTSTAAACRELLKGELAASAAARDGRTDPGALNQTLRGR